MPTTFQEASLNERMEERAAVDVVRPHGFAPPMISVEALPGGGFKVTNVGAGDITWVEHTFSSTQGLRGFLREWADQAHRKGKVVRLNGRLV